MTPAELRAWRERRGLTQAAAAPLLGMPQATLEGLEQGRRPNSALWGVLARLTAEIDRAEALERLVA